MANVTKMPPFEFTIRWGDLVPMIQAAIKDDSQWPAVLSLLEERDRMLEDYLSRQPIIFDHDADATSTRSKPWTAKTFTKVKEWSVELGMSDLGVNQTAASDLVFQLWIDDVMKLEMTMLTGEYFVAYEDDASGSNKMPDIPAGGRITIVDQTPGVDYVSTVWL